MFPFPILLILVVGFCVRFLGVGIMTGVMFHPVGGGHQRVVGPVGTGGRPWIEHYLWSVTTEILVPLFAGHVFRWCNVVISLKGVTVVSIKDDCFYAVLTSYAR